MDAFLTFRPALDAAFVTRLAIDFACVLVLIRGVYYRAHRRTDLFLTFFAINLVVFLVAFALNSTELTLTAALGLFAVFSMLRYRTEGMSATDVTYLFLVMALGLLTAVSSAGTAQLLLMGATVLGLAALLESGWLVHRDYSQKVLYDRVELLRASSRRELLEDLRLRTGMPIYRIQVDEIDLLRDSARITVYYRSSAEDELHGYEENPASAGGAVAPVRLHGAVADQQV
jgi:hypothetical protein